MGLNHCKDHPLATKNVITAADLKRNLYLFLDKHKFRANSLLIGSKQRSRSVPNRWDLQLTLQRFTDGTG